MSQEGIEIRETLVQTLWQNMPVSYMMRRFSAILAASGSILTGVCNSQAALIAQWTFETSVPTTAGSHFAEAGVNAGAGSQAFGWHADSTTYSNPVGNGSLESFSSTVWSAGDYYQFGTSLLGYQGVTLSWEQTRSATGPADFKLAYSTDGFIFTDFSDYTVDAVTWGSGSHASGSYEFFDLSAVAVLNNKSSVYFRLISKVTSASTGTSRVDDFTINATPIPEPSTFIAGALLALPFGLQGVRYLRNRKRA